MKTYTITYNVAEAIQWQHDGETFAVVSILKSSWGDTYRATILNQNEAIKLYEAIKDSILERGERLV